MPSTEPIPTNPRPLKFKWLRDNLVSPYGLALISYLFFLAACLIPPSVYTYFMQEPDLMFLDPPTILFYTLCVLSFLGGAWLIGWMFPCSFVNRKLETRIWATLFLVVPLAMGIAATLATVVFLILQHPDAIILLFAQQGSQVKDTVTLESAGSLLIAPIVLAAIIWWAYWRSFDFGLRGWKKGLVRFALTVAVLSEFAIATLLLSRGILMMAAFGLAILYTVRKCAKNAVSFRFVLGFGISIATCVILLFFSFSFLRGTSSLDILVRVYLGYTVAAYNRLAAVVNGNLRYPFAGRGLYLSGFVSFSHALNRVVPLASVMNWPDILDVWGSEFGAVTRSGLDGNLILSGTFGYIFSDLGWFSFPFVFGYGMLYGVAWNWIKRGKILGIVLYPSFAFSALLWIGTNSLLDSSQALLLATACFLAFCEFLLVRSKARKGAGYEPIFAGREAPGQ